MWRVPESSPVTGRSASMPRTSGTSSRARCRSQRTLGETMKATQKLHETGQSLWLDNITRDLLSQGTLQRYIQELSVTGLTSNPTIFNQAIKNSTAYDAPIHEKMHKGLYGEALFFDLALEDLTHAADLFLPVHQRTAGVDGWV